MVKRRPARDEEEDEEEAEEAQESEEERRPARRKSAREEEEEGEDDQEAEEEEPEDAGEAGEKEGRKEGGDAEDDEEDDDEDAEGGQRRQKRSQFRPREGFRKVSAGTRTFLQEYNLPLSFFTTLLCVVGLDYLFLSIFGYEPSVQRGEDIAVPLFVIFAASILPMIGAVLAIGYTHKEGQEGFAFIVTFVGAGIGTFFILYYFLGLANWQLPQAWADHYKWVHQGGSNNRWDVCLGIAGFMVLLFAGWYLGDTIWKRHKFNRLFDVGTKAEFIENQEDLEDLAVELTQSHQDRVIDRKYEFRIR